MLAYLGPDLEQLAKCVSCFFLLFFNCMCSNVHTLHLYSFCAGVRGEGWWGGGGGGVMIMNSIKLIERKFSHTHICKRSEYFQGNKEKNAL